MFGALVALVLEQVVQDWQESRRVAATRQALDQELRDFAVVFRLRAVVSRCVAGKLDALDAVLAAPALATLHGVGRPPYYFSSRGGWNGAAPELVSRHHGAAVALVYGEAYQGMAEYAALAQREQELWAQLQTLETAPEPASAQRLWHLRETIAGARNANLLLTAIAEQMLARTAEVAGHVDAAPLPVDVRERPICQPLGF
jgi:hypothetical protein